MDPLLEGIEISFGIIATTASKPGVDGRYGVGLAGRVLLQNLIGAAETYAFRGITKVAGNGKLGAGLGCLKVSDQLVCNTFNIVNHATHAARVVGQ